MTTSNARKNRRDRKGSSDGREILVMKVVKGVPLVHASNRAGRWGRPVMDNEGKFYKSVKALAEDLNVTIHQALRLVAKNLPHNGKHYSFASIEQTRNHVVSTQMQAAKIKIQNDGPRVQATLTDLAESALKQVEVMREQRKQSVASLIDQAEAKWIKTFDEVSSKARNVRLSASPAKLDAPFVGIQWPDGTVTVRHSGGGHWEMQRESRDALPVEILAHTRWL